MPRRVKVTAVVQRRLLAVSLALVLTACSLAKWAPSRIPLSATPVAHSLPTRLHTPIPTLRRLVLPTWTSSPVWQPTVALLASGATVQGSGVSLLATMTDMGTVVLLSTPTPMPAGSSVTPVGPAAPWVYETTVTILTYGYEQGLQATQPDDPVYPYPRLDFSQVGAPALQAYQAIVLENGYVSVTILPELGGRVYRWVDKATGRQLLYENPVVKPTSWGYRGWWLGAGGIEWVFPVEEHGLNEWRPWNHSTGYTVNGLSVMVSNVEDRTGMEVGATISLDTDHAFFTIQPWARNNTVEAHQYQLWLNAMLTLGGNHVSGQTQFVIPSSQVTVHATGDGGLPGAGGIMNWPVYSGRDMSWYRNWRGHLGFFVPAVYAGFVGLYDHSVDQGFIRAFAPGWPAGTKFFGPAGLSHSLWTDDGSTYIELWSGATGSFWSYGTLRPGENVSWSERWYPVNGLGGFNYANESAALRLTDTGSGAEISVAVSVLTKGNVTLWASGQLVGNWPLTLYPGQAFRTSWARPPGVGGTLGLRLENSGGTTIAQTGKVPQE